MLLTTFEREREAEQKAVERQNERVAERHPEFSRVLLSAGEIDGDKVLKTIPRARGRIGRI